MDNPYRFIGNPHNYRNLTKAVGWGDFFVRNDIRSDRKRPALHPGDCPFCSLEDGPAAEAVHRLRFADETYLVTNNINPIVADQLLLIPAATESRHRLDLSASDVRIAMSLARGGHDLLDGRQWACYVNALPGAGRSVAHLHINCVPAQHVPLLAHGVVPWQICRAVNGSTMSRLAGVGFFAIAVQNPDDSQLATTVAELHQQLNQSQQPYNFLVYPTSADGPVDVRVLLVPRDSEYCEAADQRIAGLEFLTGVLIPGPARQNVIDTILRDRALFQATLKPRQQLQMERQLRSVFGLPPSGDVVRARRDSDQFQAVVENNDAFENGVARSENESPRATMAYGSIDCRFWVTPGAEKPVVDFHSSRLDANVLVRITRASICQSDRRVLGRNKPGKVEGLALGHEGGGYVVDPGPWETELAAGEKVVVLPHLSCGECIWCHRYMSNLCEKMQHLGFHFNGTLATLMAFPYQCVLPAGGDFPDDALPLVEPLACVSRAMFRIRDALRQLAASSQPSSPEYLTIFGGGPMGCLIALAVKRHWPTIFVQIVEPNATRRAALATWGDVEVVATPPRARTCAISFVASSNIHATLNSIATTMFGGTVLLFSGINTTEQDGTIAELDIRTLEKIHRREQSVLQEYDFNRRVRLIGSSGYILDDVKRSLIELRNRYDSHYRILQNVMLAGLRDNNIEGLLSHRGVDDESVARTLKVLIRV